MITIVGAGPVGSLWALLLRKLGYSVNVFEKRPDPRSVMGPAGRSINLVVTSRGIHALNQAGLSSLVNRISVPVFGRMIHSKTGDLAYQAYGQQNECNFSVSRGELNKSLIDEAEKAGANFFFEHELADLNSEKKQLTFTKGTQSVTQTFDTLFGTDGSGSQLRRKLAQKYKDMRDETQWLEADYKELTLPLLANGSPALQKDALHIWPRGAHMMMALANHDGSFTMTVYLPKDSATTSSDWGFNKIRTAQNVEELFKSEFSDAIPLMPKYKEEFMHNPTGVLGTVRCNRWVFENSIALVGDAAHAIVPFFGQGMNCGFEDCTALLELHKRYSGDWKIILPEYEKLRKPNADAIADMAIENWGEMRDKVGDPKFLLRKKLEAALEARHPGVFKARYGLITYTLTPYALAQQAGIKQGQILDQILNGATSLDEISWEKADQLIETEWLAFVKNNNIDLTSYNTDRV